MLTLNDLFVIATAIGRLAHNYSHVARAFWTLPYYVAAAYEQWQIERALGIR